MVNFSTYTFTLPTKHRKTQYTLPFTLSLYQPNTVKRNILFHLHFTLSTKHRKIQYIFSATVHFFHSHFTTYDLRRFVTKQTGPKCRIRNKHINEQLEPTVGFHLVQSKREVTEKLLRSFEQLQQKPIIFLR